MTTRILTLVLLLLFPFQCFAAIARDNTALFSTGGSTNWTNSYTTNSSTNGLIVVCIRPQGAPNTTSVTYAGASLTHLSGVNGSASVGNAVDVWYGFAPTAGANNLVIVSVPNVDTAIVSTYTGVSQSGFPDATGTGSPLSDSGSVTDFTKNITTVADNSWTYMCGGPSTGGVATADTGSSMLQQSSGLLYAADSGAAKSPAGTYAIGWTKTASNWAAVYFSFAPVATAATVNPTLPTVIWW